MPAQQTPDDFDGVVFGPVGVGRSLSNIRGRQVVIFDPRGALTHRPPVDPLDPWSSEGRPGEGATD